MLHGYSEHNSPSKDYILQHVINRAETNNGSNVLSILQINLDYNNIRDKYCTKYIDEAI